MNLLTLRRNSNPIISRLSELDLFTIYQNPKGKFQFKKAIIPPSIMRFILKLLRPPTI